MFYNDFSVDVLQLFQRRTVHKAMVNRTNIAKEIPNTRLKIGGNLHRPIECAIFSYNINCHNSKEPIIWGRSRENVSSKSHFAIVFSLAPEGTRSKRSALNCYYPLCIFCLHVWVTACVLHLGSFDIILRLVSLIPVFPGYSEPAQTTIRSSIPTGVKVVTALLSLLHSWEARDKGVG